jgi:hypothetical protein
MNPILGPWGDQPASPAARQAAKPSWPRRAAGLLAYVFAPFVGMALGLLASYHIEMAWWPVVTDFRVASIAKVPGGYRVAGSYNKRRSCELISTSLLAVNPARPELPAQLVHQLKHQDEGANLPIGPVHWGPYLMPAPASFGTATHIRAVSLHRCHALWLHESHYVTLPIAALP